MKLEERVEKLENALSKHMGKEQFSKSGTGIQEALRLYIMYWLNPDSNRYHPSSDDLERLGLKWGEKSGISREDLWIVLDRIRTESK